MNAPKEDTKRCSKDFNDRDSNNEELLQNLE